MLQMVEVHEWKLYTRSFHSYIVDDLTYMWRDLDMQRAENTLNHDVILRSLIFFAIFYVVFYARLVVVKRSSTC